MPKLVATTNVTINQISSNEDYLVIESIESADAERVELEIRCTDLNSTHYEAFDCEIISSKQEDVTVVETIAVTSDNASLSKVPSHIDKVEFTLNPDNFGLNDIQFIGEKILVAGYEKGAFFEIQVTYTYRRTHLKLKYSPSSGVKFHKTGSDKEEVKAVLRARYKDLVEVQAVTFTYKFPELSVEVSTTGNDTTLKIYSTANALNTTCTITGATIKGSNAETESVEESVTFSGGIGYTTKAVSAIENVSFSVNSGAVSVDTSEYTRNRLKFVPHSSGFGGSIPASLEAVATISYTTVVKEIYVIDITGNAGYKVEDEYGNSVVGSLQAADSGAKDISVKVYDYLTGLPLSGAKVSLAGKTATTDTNGMATFKGLSKGRYKVVVEKAGYYSNLQDNLVNEYIDV